MAFANWKSKKSQSATATLATVATHKGKTGDYLPSVATVATVAGLESLKSDRYAHLIACQQCEHLTLTGYCRVKPQYKPMPEAMRDCSSFEAVSGERVAITNAPYSVSELNDLLSRYEKKLFHHLVDCVACSFMDSRYCVDAFAIGSSYDAMLMVLLSKNRRFI